VVEVLDQKKDPSLQNDKEEVKAVGFASKQLLSIPNTNIS